MTASGEKKVSAEPATSMDHWVIALHIDWTAPEWPYWHQLARWLAAEGQSLALMLATPKDLANNERLLELLLELQAAGAIVMAAPPLMTTTAMIDVVVLEDLIDAFGRVDLCIIPQMPHLAPAVQRLPARLNVLVPQFAAGSAPAGAESVRVTRLHHARGDRLHGYEICLPLAGEITDSMAAAIRACLQAIRPPSK